jgi:hypothetical protein
LKQLAAVAESELRFDKQKWTIALGPICSTWKNLYKKDTFDGIQITQQHLNVVDPVEAFVYMEILNVKGILGEVNESIQTIINILNGSAMLTDKSM